MSKRRPVSYNKYSTYRKKVLDKRTNKALEERNLRTHPGLCPSCNGEPELKLDSSHAFYGVNHGPIWECKCGARVRCHPNTTLPLGTVATKRDRQARRYAHDIFDSLWSRIVRPEEKKFFLDRVGAYQWLSAKLGIPTSKCHMGMMNVEQCNKIIALCEKLKETGIK